MENRLSDSPKWVVISGDIAVSGGSLSYTPMLHRAGATEGELMFGIVRSNIEFQTGTVTFQIKLQDPRSACHLILNHGLPSELHVGLNFGDVPYAMMRVRDGNWEQVVWAGAGSQPDTNRWIPIRISVLGSRVELYIDEVLVCRAYEIVDKSQLAMYFHGGAPSQVKWGTVQVERPRAFVVMQFSDEFDKLYAEVIRPVCAEFGFEAIRADDQYTSGLIINDIVRAIHEASVVVADITPDNPNVYYEVGFAHGVGKSTILLCDRERERLPFDLSGFRTLFYHNVIGGKQDVAHRLRRHLESMAA